MAEECQNTPELISDGAGGAIVTWIDERSGESQYDIYAQHIDASGTVQWIADGVPLCTAAGYQLIQEITSDGAGGAIVTWQDDRNDNVDIYAQHIDASGTVQLTADGIPLCTATGGQQYPGIASDGVGGAVVAWQDDRCGDYCRDIYAQQIAGVIAGTETLETPKVAFLEQNYPNPFNPQTTIRFGLAGAGSVTLMIYDPAGRLVTTIIDETMPAGHYSETWDGKDSNGSAVSSGVYFYKLDTGSIAQTRKMILLR